MRFRNRKGFTLIELLIVIIIVGILAAVSVPMMMGNLRRARASEAVATLGTIRTAMRLERAEHAAYDDTVVVGDVIGNVPGFIADDLDGRFFTDEAYTITAVGADTFTAQANGNAVGCDAGVADITVQFRHGAGLDAFHPVADDEIRLAVENRPDQDIQRFKIIRQIAIAHDHDLMAGVEEPLAQGRPVAPMKLRQYTRSMVARRGGGSVGRTVVHDDNVFLKTQFSDAAPGLLNDFADGRFLV